jgi:hypothetical protein
MEKAALALENGARLGLHLRLMPSPRRFPPPWSIEEHTESFIVKDATGQALAFLYFEDEPQRQMSMKRLSRDEAFLIAVNIAKLSSDASTNSSSSGTSPHATTAMPSTTSP